MIVVTVELYPMGPRQHLGVQRVCEARIWNDEAKTLFTQGAKGNYHATFSKREGKTEEVWARGRVLDFDRRARGEWDLLFLALKSAVGRRNLDGLAPVVPEPGETDLERAREEFLEAARRVRLVPADRRKKDDPLWAQAMEAWDLSWLSLQEAERTTLERRGGESTR